MAHRRRDQQHFGRNGVHPGLCGDDLPGLARGGGRLGGRRSDLRMFRRWHVALDFPHCHVECRFVATASPDSLGADADRLELRFLSAGDRLDIAASSVQVGAYSHEKCQAAIHAQWTAATEAPTERETGPRVSAIAVESNPINVHLVCESPLFRKERALVKPESSALQCHNPLEEVAAAVVPPLIDGPAVRPVDQAPMLAPALTGPIGETIAATPASSAKPSMTNPGQLPQPGSSLVGSLVPPRRTLERRGDSLDCSAMTPQAFVEAARRAWWPVHSSQESQVTIEEVISSSPAVPKSFAPPKPDVTDV